MNNSTYGLTFRLFAITLLMAQSFLSAFVVQGTAGIAHAQVPPVVTVAPTIDTNISIYKDGTVPFDTNTWTDASMGNSINDAGTNEGQDANDINGIVRLNDIITYKVDISVNDSSATEVVTTVTLDTDAAGNPKQTWEDVPVGCYGTEHSYSQDSMISLDGLTLTCILGNAIEGTKYEIFPQARVMPIVGNDGIVEASASTDAVEVLSPYSSPSSGPVTTITTADFGVNLVKGFGLPAQDYKPKFWVADPEGVDGNGYVLTYKINASYKPGSQIATHNGSYLQDYYLIDNFSYISSSLGTKAKLYTPDPCGITTSAGTVTCTQPSGPGMVGTDLNTVEFDIDGIDVRNSQLFAIYMNIWLPLTDIEVGNPLGVHNDIYFGAEGGLTGKMYEPVAIDGTLNYGGTLTDPGEPLADNYIDYQIVREPAGTVCDARNTFWGFGGAGAYPKNGARTVAPGEIFQSLSQVGLSNYYAESLIGQCNKIDNSTYELVGLTKKPGPIVSRHNTTSVSLLTHDNPSLMIYDTANSPVYRPIFGGDRDITLLEEMFGYKLEYASMPHDSMQNDPNNCSALPSGTADEIKLRMTCFQRDATCEDDMDADGGYDWVSDPSLLPGGLASVTKVRHTIDYSYSELMEIVDEEYFQNGLSYGSPYIFFGNGFDYRVKTDAQPGDLLPIITARMCPGDPEGGRNDWYAGEIGIDPTNTTTYSFHGLNADRVRVVPATISVSKTTLPEDRAYVNAGDIVTYKISPTINGYYVGATDVVLNDTLPPSGVYVGGSAVANNCGSGQVFVDGDSLGVMNEDGDADIQFVIEDVQADLANGNPLCDITYDVQISFNAAAGDYINTVTMDTANRVDPNGDPLTGKVYDTTGSGAGPKTAVDGVTIDGGGSKFDVRKFVDQQVYPVETPFTYELSYANLGSEDFNTSLTGAFIDVLPYTANDWRSTQALGDGGLGNGVCGATQESTSGPNSCRQPPSDFNGTYQLTNLDMPNGEQNCFVTTDDPATISLDVEVSGPNGTSPANWTSVVCTGNPGITDISAFYFEVPAIPSGTLRQSFEIELTPTGNKANDIYTNSFGGEIPDIDLKVISNDVFVTTVSFDLALDKQINTTLSPAPYLPGDSVVYDITVYNQGTYDADGIEIIDYIPAGLTLDPTTTINTANGWTAAGTTTVPAIPVGGSEIVQIELTIDGTVTEGSIVNWSEITAGYPVDENGDELTAGIGLVDGDSTPDSTQFNGDGETDDLDDDNVIDESGLDTANDGDEDDHDPAEIMLATFDLALTKVLATTGTVAPGDDVTFTIELFNQGDLDGYNIEVTDHIPTGLTLNDPNWMATGTDMATYTYVGPLAASGSDTIDIVMTVDATFTGTSLTNWSEISSADNDTDATNGFPTDLDSTPNAENFSEAGETDDLDDDNVIDEDGKNDGDEDDHDPAQLTITQTYDLALTKTYKEYADLDADNTISQGDDVTFNVSVMNQGTLPAANIEVSDYIPTGMTLSANDTNGWTPGAGSTGTVTNAVTGPILPGAGETIEIVLTIDADFQGFELINWAEISADDAATYGMIDVDSTPDADQFSGDGETDDLDDDNVIDEDGTDTANDGDEDDHDPAMIPVGQVFDLALSKTLTTTGTIQAGDDVTFTIEVFNQGSLDATDVQITDYIPTGMTLSANDTNGWTDAGTTATNTIASLAMQSSTTIDIMLTVDADFTQGDLINWAEISDDNASIHGAGITDIDSTPDAENMNTGGEADGLANDDVTDNTNGDEDDHDPAMITVSEYDLALIQQYLTYTDTNGDGVLSAGDDVTFKITVNNQGNLDAADIELTNYIPEGTSLSASDANGWGTAGDTGSVTQTIANLAAGGMTMMQIVLTIDEGFQGTEIINWAEISADNADEYGVADVDSMPDAINFNTTGETDDLDDNNINDEDGKNDGDEDDHDPALVTVDQFFDLALTKKLITPGIIKPGDTVSFEIEVTNQGTLNATDVVVSDYIPGGLTLQADANWSMNGAEAEAIIASIPGVVGAEDPSVVLTINFTADGSAAGWVTNWSEISRATDGEGNEVTDIDSTPDTTNGEDAESTVNDVIDGTDGDEDDHDLAEVRLGVFDLALRKTLNTAQLPVYQGESVTFQIEVFNQGNLDATDVEITDYIPAELTLNDADWTDKGTTATYVIAGPLLPQTSVVVDVTMMIDPDYQGDSITNWAEISSSDNDADASTPAIPDDDSTEDNNQTNDGYDGADNVIDERGVDGGDEDDHDPEQFPVGQIYDLALAKTIASEGPYMQGEEVTFTLEVTNQGTLDASGIELTDYIPTGLVLADADWTANGDMATYLIPGTLAHGDSTTVDITFTIISGDGELTNWAEISADNAASYAGIGITADVDSTPDANNGVAGESPVNDAIDGTGGDEDDHDLETIQVQSTNDNGGGNNNSSTPVFESAPEAEEVEEVEVIAEVEEVEVIAEVEEIVVEEIIEEVIEFVPTVQEVEIIEIIQSLKLEEENKALDFGNSTHNSAGALDVELPTFLPQTGA